MNKKRVFLASDHAGFKLKEIIKQHLKNKDVKDIGSFKFQKDDDYPDYIIPCAKAVAKNNNSIGIIIGLSGQGEAITANKIKGIHSIVYYSPNLEIIKLAREHNNANILSLSSKFLTTKQALSAIDLFIKTKFSNETRHKRRIKKIEKIK